MRKILITFSGAKYYETTKRTVEISRSFGVDDVWVYDDHWLVNHRRHFVERNKYFFDHPRTRGFGWFIWKPYVVLDALNRLENGDVVLFVDADTYPIHDLSVIYDIAARDGVMLFAAEGCFNRHWCKRDCLIVTGCDHQKYHGEDVQHAVARFMAFRKGAHAPTELLWEWLGHVQNPTANTFDPSSLAPEYPGFREHRCEQAILTLMAHKFGYPLYREACQFGTGIPRQHDLYPQLFIQEGSHSWAPGATNHSFGSTFRNVND